MKIVLVSFSKGRTAWADDAAREYERRVRRYGPFEERQHRPKDPASESARLLRSLGPRDRLVVLDQRGRSMTSEGLADWIREAQEDGIGELVFAIGGPEGHDASARQQAWQVANLSGLILNHQVARVVMMEQLYRAWTILRGEPYHRP